MTWPVTKSEALEARKITVSQIRLADKFGLILLRADV
jgi:hypothetical protein